MTAEPAPQIVDAVKNRRRAAEMAARVLAEGGLVAFPTETVYGLGADATNGQRRCPALRGQGPSGLQPADRARRRRGGGARAWRNSTAAAERLAEAFWPGPLTLVLPKAAGCPVADLATAGLDSIALRVPDHPVAQRPARGVRPAGGGAIGESVGPRLADHGGACAGRPARAHRTDRRRRPDADGARIDHRRLPRRAGAAAARRACRATTIERVLGRPLATPVPTAGDAPVAPGQLASHYAPRARLRLDATSVTAGEALLAFGPQLAGRRRARRARAQPLANAAT